MPQKKKDNKNKNTDQGEYVLVYSTDPKPEESCKGCLRPKSACVCKDIKLVKKEDIKPVVSIERKGRGGKSVTLISRLPRHETFLKDMLKFLKKNIGTGGTSYFKDEEGVIEIQGEQVDKIRDLIERYKDKVSVRGH